LGFPSPVASLILSPLQVTINKQTKLEASFITSVPHQPKAKNPNANTITTNYTNINHCHNYRQAAYNTDYKDDNELDNNEDMNDNENNYNFNNTTAKRKWESPDATTYTKYKKATDSSGHVSLKHSYW
jgi:hypothetical protein